MKPKSKIEKENFALKSAVKKRTLELEQKKRELEIEASLEKVRVVAPYFILKRAPTTIMNITPDTRKH